MKPNLDGPVKTLINLSNVSMDGTRSILDIARIQSKKTGDDIDEAARRIVQFMRYIAKRGWIKFKLAEPKPNSRRE
jgi:hypothetical protein